MHKTHYVTCNINNIANKLNYIAKAGLYNTLKYPERCRLLNATGWIDWTQTVGPPSFLHSLSDKHNYKWQALFVWQKLLALYVTSTTTVKGQMVTKWQSHHFCGKKKRGSLSIMHCHFPDRKKTSTTVFRQCRVTRRLNSQCHSSVTKEKKVEKLEKVEKVLGSTVHSDKKVK